MNFYQSDLRKYINQEIYKKPTFELEFLGKKYFGIIKEQRKFGRTFRRYMIHGIQLATNIPTQIRRELQELHTSYKQSGNIFFQLGIIDSIAQLPTKNLKDAQVTEQLRIQRMEQRREFKEKYSLRPSRREHMPDATLTLDLTIDIGEMKQRFSRSCKRLLNKATKADLSFHVATESERSSFREIRYTMAHNKGFHVLPQETFFDLMKYITQTDQGKLFVVKQDGRIVSGSVVLFFSSEKELVYLYGATDRSFGAIGAHYMLQYEIMKRGNSHHYHTMDMLGVAPPGFESGHQLAGVTRFKQSFGGETVVYTGNYDIVVNPLLYKLFQRKHRK